MEKLTAGHETIQSLKRMMGTGFAINLVAE